MACGLVLGLKDGVLPDLLDGSDSGLPGDERPVLTPDASTALCEGLDGSYARALQADGDSVFVLQGGSTIVSSCGTKVNPCGTIAVGIVVANANRAKAIYVGPGTYPETVALPSGVSLEGGFAVQGSSWTALCENITTKLQPSAAVVVSANGILNAAIRFLTIETKAHGDVGESLFGVIVTNAALTIDNVNIYAELGGSGSNGSAGTGTETIDNNCSENGATGASGPAALADAGMFTATGYQVAPQGNSGGSGLRGAGGIYSAPSCSSACVTCSSFVFPLDDAGVPVDDAGNEITDGATSTCLASTQKMCAGDVAMACGGHGGLGGLPGGSGAASVAVIAIGPTTALTISGGALVVAGGGLGGNGGIGASGLQGGAAASGTSNSNCMTTCDSTCTAANVTVLNGAKTTAGGGGGTGGFGGGGAGGPTFLIVTVGGAIVTMAQTTQWQIPTVGAHGGLPNGPSGLYAEQFP